jgi:hypothetical protein
MVVTAVTLAACALWGSSRLAWSSEVSRRPGTDATIQVSRTGAEIAPLVPLALLAVAGLAATIALGGWPRRAVGVVLAAAGATAAALGPLAGPAGDPVVWGRLLAVLGGVLLVAAGLLLVWRGAALPRLGAGYRPPAAVRETGDRDGDMWQSLSHGRDPTTDEG